MIMFYQQGSLVVNDKQLPLMDSGWLEDEQGGGLYLVFLLTDSTIYVVLGMHVNKSK
jgi:hypothetical protein